MQHPYYKNINTTAIDFLWIVTRIRHASYGRRHVQRYWIPIFGAVGRFWLSLAGVYASPTKSALAGV